MDKLFCMIELQQELNDATNGEGWENGSTKEGKAIDWRRCIYMESAEMIDSFPWKHWKSIAQPADYANLQIEIVDVWHFIMSLVLETQKKGEGLSPAELSAWMAGLPAYSALAEERPTFAADETLMKQIEAMMRHALDPERGDGMGAIVDDFFALAAMGSLNLDQLYRLYVGKNILNRFRQDHGYKEGRYVKVWNGLEDNAVMKQAWEANPDLTPDALYAVLEEAYPR